MKITTEANVGWKLLTGAALMTVAPLLFFCFFDGFFWSRTKFVRWKHPPNDCSEQENRLWPIGVGCPDRCYVAALRAKLYDMASPTPQFATLLVGMVIAFAATAGQFVASHWYMMKMSGNRDVCYYNEKCYYPASPIELPLNHMLSHVPYFLAGLHLLYQATYAEFHVSKVLGDNSKLEFPFDPRPFYAVAVTFGAEGLGSLFYHVCPSVETFQFDTCFMIPIAHMCSAACLHWRVEPLDGIKYLLFVLLPVWMYNCVGTWCDVRLMQVFLGYLYAPFYVCFSIGLIHWSLIVAKYIDTHFNVGDEVNGD
jgi:hypothetical protein